jgi:hypothetical protein
VLTDLCVLPNPPSAVESPPLSVRDVGSVVSSALEDSSRILPYNANRALPTVYGRVPYPPEGYVGCVKGSRGARQYLCQHRRQLIHQILIDVQNIIA